MSRNAIEITGLRKTYAASKGQTAKEALKGIDLTVPAGSIFGLLGPNGAGKSTLINILAGLVLKTEGNVKIWGFDQDVNPRQSRASIGVMPQELNLDPFFSPQGALEVQAGLYGVPKSQRRTAEILELVGLTDKANAYARTLSGGMQRRLLLGKALVHTPHILVLDEPTAALGVAETARVEELIASLKARNLAILIISHSLDQVFTRSDRICVLRRGEQIGIRNTAETDKNEIVSMITGVH